MPSFICAFLNSGIRQGYRFSYFILKNTLPPFTLLQNYLKPASGHKKAQTIKVRRTKAAAVESASGLTYPHVP